MQKNFWVGDRPAGTWVFQVLDQKSGVVQDLTGYTSVTVLLLDPRNKPVELPAGSAVISDAPNGRVAFFWPAETLFTAPGVYVMQLQLDSGTASRRTTVQQILVRELGGVIK
jgi:hypothetical protein